MRIANAPRFLPAIPVAMPTIAATTKRAKVRSTVSVIVVAFWPALSTM
ncbi:hypothetical protein HMPREF0298_2251 [Corynebacterium lipophiloflavum DSM 44291]|uniref:Uncharacterized protein n=1 Tax=Corynebacterium lipophiloflavum (strain ATCC 700352 / DSM 44291 / CCUG 37336 / JCM 10383 / DMMZ 1944) TaxID=525263 RepID=C0XUY1_CORLD|nr:hypothetical protein HMPREF0298_2251 [Corynebacterium lipophiloflavum DSM 44291]